VDMHGAGAALRDAAAEFGAGHSEDVAQHPEQGHVGGGIERFGFAVDCERGRHRVPPVPQRCGEAIYCCATWPESPDIFLRAGGGNEGTFLEGEVWGGDPENLVWF